MKTYKPHELALLFPLIEGEERARLKKSIQVNGQIDPIVLFNGKILDGRNRYDLCIEEGIEPRTITFETLPLASRKNGPLEYVFAKNFDRRHLTSSQKAMIASDSLPFFEAEAAEAAKKAPNGAKSNSGDETSQDTGSSAEDESQARGKPGRKPTGGKAAEKAARAAGTSTRQVERAKKIAKKSPKKAAAVRAGKLSLSKAEKDAKKEANKKTELADALKRIGSVIGKDAAEVMAKRKRAEIIELAGMKDEDIKKGRGLLIDSGWPLARVKKYKMFALTRKHNLGDLATRALHAGVAKSGTFELPFTHEGTDLVIIVKAAK